MQILNLSPSQPDLIGAYIGNHVIVLCDTTASAFTVTLPDAFSSQDVMFEIVNTGNKTLTIQTIKSQRFYINYNETFTLTLNPTGVLRTTTNKADRYIVLFLSGVMGNYPAGNYMGFDADGFQTAYGNAQGWDDIIIPIASGKVSAVNAPDWTVFTTHTSAYTFKVNDFIDCATVEWLHDSLENGTGYVHVHWANNQLEAVDKYVKFTVYHTFSKDGVAFPDDTPIESADILIPANTAHRTSFMSHIGTINLSGYEKGTQIKSVFKRVAATGTAPANNPFIGQIGIHRKINKPCGSKTMT